MDAAIDRKRRSHLRRQATTKGVQITDNDVRDIFEPLARHAQLTTRQLVSFGRRHPTVTKARLGELWHATERRRSHWLHRLNEDLVLADHLHVDDLHRLGAEGEAMLVAKGLIPAEPWVSATCIGGNSRMPSRIMRLAHDHMASDIVLDIEIGARGAGVSFRNHIDIVRNAPTATRLLRKPLRMPVVVAGRPTHIEPDALFAIGRRIYALEADSGSESIRAVIVPKILAYREAVAAGVIDAHLGIDQLTVLFATTSEQRMRHVMAELAAIARNGRSTMFGFRAETGFGGFLRASPPTGRLASAPWLRVGHEALILTSD